MNIQQLREQFAAELKRHRLPRAYIERLLAEWDDHLQDLQEERSTDMARTPDLVNFQQRLGDPAQLAAVAAKQYHHRSFLGRHPILTFLILPYPLAMLGLFLMGVALTLFAISMEYLFHGMKTEQYPVAQNIFCMLLAWLFIVLPPLGTVLLLCRIARRNTLKWSWCVAASLIVAFFVGMFHISWRLATLPGTGMLMIGMGFYPSSTSWMFLNFIPKFALAISVGVLLIKRAQRLQRMDESRQKITVLRQAA